MNREHTTKNGLQKRQRPPYVLTKETRNEKMYFKKKLLNMVKNRRRKKILHVKIDLKWI